jgi:hypothetical protein
MPARVVRHRPGRHGKCGRSQEAASASSPSSARMCQACRAILRASDGQGSALAVDAVLGLRVVPVVGGRGGRGPCRPQDGPAQHRRSLPGQAAPGSFAVGGVHGDVQPGEPDDLAGGREPARSGQSAGQRQSLNGVSGSNGYTNGHSPIDYQYPDNNGNTTGEGSNIEKDAHSGVNGRTDCTAHMWTDADYTGAHLDFSPCCTPGQNPPYQYGDLGSGMDNLNVSQNFCG